MKRALLEQRTVVVLFVLVLIVFSFAARDSKKLTELYSKKTATKPALVKASQYALAQEEKQNTTRFSR